MQRRQVRFGDCSVTSDVLIDEVVRVLQSGQFILGTEVSLFARAWADYCGTSHCVATASGSSALTTSLKATNHLMKLPEVWNIAVLPAYSFAATVFSVMEAGFKPVYVDVDKCGLIDWEQVDDLLNTLGDNVAVVVPVHLYGQVLEIPSAILDRDVVVVEDACQVHGYKGVQGIVACYSFYPAKNLGAAGDAGAIVTDDGDVTMRAYRYVNYGDGPGEKYRHSTLGTNQRMDAIQAAFLRKKLEMGLLDAHNAIRIQQAMMYDEAGIATIASGTPNYYHLYPIKAASPQVLRDRLEALGIATGNHYPYILPDVVRPAKEYHPIVNARKLADQVVTLPIGPHLNLGQIGYVCDQLLDIAEYDGTKWVMKRKEE